MAKAPVMTTCHSCGGYGLRMYGLDVDTCYTCGGGGKVEARDARGRFLPWVEQTTLAVREAPRD